MKPVVHKAIAESEDKILPLNKKNYNLIIENKQYFTSILKSNCLNNNNCKVHIHHFI